MNKEAQTRKQLPAAPTDPDAVAVAAANYKRGAVLPLKDMRQTLAAEVTAARDNITRLQHFQARGDRVFFSPEKARAAVKRFDDATKALADFTAANPDLPA